MQNSNFYQSIVCRFLLFLSRIYLRHGLLPVKGAISKGKEVTREEAGRVVSKAGIVEKKARIVRKRVGKEE